MLTKEQAFPLPLLGEFIGKHQWKLTHPFEFHNPPIKRVIPKGFITDGKSIPRIVWTLIGSPWSGQGAKSAVNHDYHYHIQTITRKAADKEFLLGLKILGVGWVKRRIMYCAIRIFAGFAWTKRYNVNE